MVKSDYKMSCEAGFLSVERPRDYEVIPEEQPAMLAEIRAACEEAGLRKVLLTGSKTKVSLSVLDLYELGQQIAKLGLKIAVVESHDAGATNVGFLETVAFNRGGSLEFFDNETDAKNWLGIK